MRLSSLLFARWFQRLPSQQIFPRVRLTHRFPRKLESNRTVVDACIDNSGRQALFPVLAWSNTRKHEKAHALGKAPASLSCLCRRPPRYDYFPVYGEIGE